MARSRISKIVGLTAAVTMAGCAHRSAETDVSTPQVDAPGPTTEIDPGNPADIVTLGKRLTHDRLALFSVKEDKYTFYVGGVLNATYEMGSNILRISALTPADDTAQTCEYSPQGVLFVDTQKQADKKDFANECNDLAERLNGYLSR